MTILTEIARKAIEGYLKDDDFYPNLETKEKYSTNRASFVTITKNNQLRGCIGSLEAHQPLWEDVKENAIKAAFHDSRFQPIKDNELPEIKIEVSILSEPEKIEVKHSKFLTEKITKDMGLILKFGNATSTFLPQVWDEITDKTEFLERLSLKAGLEKDDWKKSEIYFYTIKKESE